MRTREREVRRIERGIRVGRREMEIERVWDTARKGMKKVKGKRERKWKEMVKGRGGNGIRKGKRRCK